MNETICHIARHSLKIHHPLHKHRESHDDTIRKKFASCAGSYNGLHCKSRAGRPTHSRVENVVNFLFDRRYEIPLDCRSKMAAGSWKKRFAPVVGAGLVVVVVWQATSNMEMYKITRLPRSKGDRWF